MSTAPLAPAANSLDAPAREDHSFDSEGVRCAAWFYPAPAAPAGTAPPLVILGHGLSGVRHMRLDDYARDFQAAGMAVFVFDYRGFGDSDGMPRQVVDAGMQLADWRAALRYARAALPIDRERIGIWGTSFSGGHVMTLAAEDREIAAAISQAPFTDGRASFLRRIRHFPPSAFILGVAAVLDMILARFGRGPLLMPVAGTPWMPAFCAAPGTLAATTNLVPPGSTMGRRASRFIRLIPGMRRALGTRVAPSKQAPPKGRDSLWGVITTPDGEPIINAIAARTALQLFTHRPLTRLKATGDTPVLICVCDGDEVAPAGPTVAAARGLGNVELRHFNVGHFELYAGEPREQAVAAQVHFLQQHLGVRAASA